jgi:hypothetical protein
MRDSARWRCYNYSKNEAELQALQYGNEVLFIPCTLFSSGAVFSFELDGTHDKERAGLPQDKTA